MKHIIELDQTDLAALFGDGLTLESGEAVTLRAKLSDAPNMKDELTEAFIQVSNETADRLRLACHCGKEFSTEHALNVHKGKSHKAANGNGSGNGKLPSGPAREGFKFVCTDDDCEMSFHSAKARDEHMELIHGD